MDDKQSYSNNTTTYRVKHMEKDELIKNLSEVLPDNADITFATVTWFDDDGVHHWDTDDKKEKK